MSLSSQELMELRREYISEGIVVSKLNNCPYEQFEKWFSESLQQNVMEPNAMALSTADLEGNVKSRMVLLKQISKEKGFVFFSNYNSKKAQQIENNNKVALLFYWDMLKRQIRISGEVQKLSEKESVDYFNSRPLASRVASILSKQSSLLKDKKSFQNEFDRRLEKAKSKKSLSVVKPEYWGGYAVKAVEIEFWQGREHRLHDRVVYHKKDHSWSKEMLYP